METLTVKTPAGVLSFIGQTLGLRSQESLVDAAVEAFPAEGLGRAESGGGGTKMATELTQLTRRLNHADKGVGSL
ncbi:hypothetical protein [Arthrobacter sp. B2a2-09]|uniref:hypothetical protein n=1 Tax=Arthrobacter sp. B2a2-09 TaxID=2952822 RepID=UPI0022CD9FCB|nr:hypothetical protein [Arthrobacter sp. B2a2-09]MCZ9882807.1 hypothetical protein [Arthrobacter sp. B2a2-09]